MNDSIRDSLDKVRNGFESLKVDSKYKNSAIAFIETWLRGKEFSEYTPQIQHLIANSDWDYLLDCFYQVIPFGTGGRRGEVGTGPNRINKWTIMASAQGHSQYLKKIYGEEGRKRGVVLSYGVREFFGNKHLSDDIPNPVRNLKGLDLANAAAGVYAANSIKVFLFEGPRTTPELSFAIRYLKACAGDMFDASHNPPEHNGKKVYDEFGGQLIPPHDEKLVNEVTQNVSVIRTTTFKEAKGKGLLEYIGKDVDEAYVKEISNLSLSPSRGIKIVYTPLHGVGSTSVFLGLQRLGFKVLKDPKTSNQSGKFENVTFNIPNPEVIQSFDTTLTYAKKENADLILNSDPDADRIGIMVNHSGTWHFLNGNEIGAILTKYAIDKKKKQVKRGIVVKTTVTTNLAAKICQENGVEIVGELPVGFKYIGEVMNSLEKRGRIFDFLLGIEESNGYIAGNYVRDKDAAVAAIWLSELAAELKLKEKTLIDYLNKIYSTFGYFRNYLTEIRLPGAEGMEQISKIQSSFRESPLATIGDKGVDKVEDFLDRTPLVSETDKAAKNLLIYHLVPVEGTRSIRVTIRPSGTEPKIKVYFEIGTEPFRLSEYNVVKEKIEVILKKVEVDFMKECYKILGVDFPDRGFLIFWQVPLKDKLRYFEIEDELESFKALTDPKEKAKRADDLLAFLGSDAIKKVDDAFRAKNNVGIKEFLGL